MGKCDKCGNLMPFAGCPTCPPQIAKCGKCGAQVIVEYMTDEDLGSIMEDYHERASQREGIVDLGDFKGGTDNE